MSAAKPLELEEEIEPGPTSSAEPVNREKLRSRRKRDVRAKTISVQRMTKRSLEVGRAIYPPEEHEDVQRPKIRADCETGDRPCPFVSCKHHLYLDVSRTGAIKLNFPDLEPDEIPETCALDVAHEDGATLERVAELTNMTRERIRQIEVHGLTKIRGAVDGLGLHALEEERLERSGAPARRDWSEERKRRHLPVLQSNREECDESESDDDASSAGGEFDAAEFASEELDAD